MRPRWPGHYFSQFEKRLPQPEIKSTLPSVSFDPRSFIENLFLSKLLLTLLHYFIIFG